MADKMLNGNSLPSTTSFTDIICSNLHTMNNVDTKKRHIDAIDQSVLDDETCKKRTLNEEIESNAFFESELIMNNDNHQIEKCQTVFNQDSSEDLEHDNRYVVLEMKNTPTKNRTIKSLREEVHVIAKKIELIEDSLMLDNIAKENITTSPCFNKLDNEISAPPYNEKDKSHNEKISTSQNNSVKIKHVPDNNDSSFLYQPAKKKIKLEENVNCMIFHNNTNGSSDRDSKSLTNLQIEILLKSSYGSNKSMLDNDDFADLESSLVIEQDSRNYTKNDEVQTCEGSEHFINVEQFTTDKFFFGSENCCNSSVHMNTQTSCFGFFEVNKGSRSNSSHSLQTDQTQINYDLDCNDLKVCTELSHPVQNVIILENENIVTVNEKILVKDSRNLSGSSQAFHDEFNLCDDEFHSNKDDDSVILLDKIVLDDFFKYSNKNNDINMFKNNFESSDLEKPTEMSRQVDNVIILEYENISITNENVFVKDSDVVRDSSSAVHDEIDLCDDELYTNTNDDSIILLNIMDLNDDINYSIKNNDNNMCKRYSKNLRSQNFSESSVAFHDVIDLCDEKFYSNKVYSSVTLLDETVLDDDSSYSIKKNDSGIYKNLKNSINLTSQNVMDASSVIHDEIDLCGEEFCSNKVDGNITLLDKIVLDNCIDNSTKNSDSCMFKINCKSMNNLEEKLMEESPKNVDDDIELNLEDDQPKKNYETLISNTVECNKSINGFGNETNTNSQNYVPPLNYDGGTITDLNKSVLSLSASEVDRILESSISISGSSDVSLLFMPSKRDLLKYEIDEMENLEEVNQTEVEKKEKQGESLSTSNAKSCLNTLKEELKQPSYDSINHLKSSNVVKDGEDNVTFFYDCDLSSIENSDVEEDDKDHETMSKSCENSTLLNYWNKKKKNQSKNANRNSSFVDQTICHKQFETQNLDDQFVCSSTNITQNLNSSICCDHKYHKVMARSTSNQQTQLNKCEVQCCMANPSNKANVFNHTDIDSESVNYSNIKCMSNNTMPKCSSIHDINTIQSDNLCIDQTNLNDDKIELKSYKNETDEKPDTNELSLDDSISPYIFQSLVKSSISENLDNALAKKAAANIDVNAMGNNTLCTYLSQQTMTLDVLRVLHKSLDSCPSSSILLEDPNGLVVPLMEHQKHAIAWLMWRESQEPRGGILADDMGLGKTLSMISLVLKSEENQDCVPVVSNDNNRNDHINGGTLVICPASLLSQWENEVRTKVIPGRLNVGQYYGVNRSTSASELAKHDLVTTSYNIVMWDYKKLQNSSPLFRINWKRIILDEAHNIRNHKTKTSIAVCNMTCVNHWALTGTPIHNKEADFFTLLKFIGCKPFDNWPVWKRWVGNNDDAGKHRLSLLVKTLMLRRTKKELSQFTTFNLPSKIIHTVEVELTKEERNAYIQLLQFSSRLFATYLFDRALKAKLVDSNIDEQCKIQYFQDQSKEKENVFKDHPELLKLFKKFTNIVEVQSYHILVLFLRLRQICCHPCLIKGIITEENIGGIIPKNEDLSDNDASDDDNVSGVLGNDNATNIASSILNDEITDLSDLMNSLSLNNEEEPDKKINMPIDSNDIFKKSWLSSKIKAVCDMVWEKVLKDDGREKAIIVSQWSSMLYLIRLHLSQYDVKMEIFSGSIPILKRNSIIRKFNNTDSGPQILLLSLTAGGVGLNLMAANHMFMVDVHWNPQLEAQACDRIYRVGQTKPVNIYKFVCANTIETKIVTIQAKKLAIAQNLIEGGASVASSKITLDDLKTVFQM